MHDRERIKSRCQIIHNDAGTFREPLQSPNWKRLRNIEDTKEYKTHEKCFPRERDGGERNQLTGDFVNDDGLRILQAGSARHLGCGGNSDEGDERGRDDSRPGAACGRDMRTSKRPQDYGGD